MPITDLETDMWYRIRIVPVGHVLSLLIPVVGILLLGFGGPSPVQDNLRARVEAVPGEPSDQQVYEVRLTGLNESGTYGQALLLTPPSGFKAHLDVTGLAPGQYALYIHEGGSCASYGKRITALKPFPRAGEDGRIQYGRSDIAPPDELAQRTLVVHGPGEGAPAVACGAINAARPTS